MTRSMHRLLCHLVIHHGTDVPVTSKVAKAEAQVGHGVFLKDMRALMGAGWVSRRVEVVPSDVVRPPRMLYSLTSLGVEQGVMAIARYERRSMLHRLGKWRLRMIWGSK